MYILNNFNFEPYINQFIVFSTMNLNVCSWTTFIKFFTVVIRQ